MPYCSQCQTEYPAGTETCPVCHHLLADRRPAWRPYDPDEPFVVVRTVYNELQAHLLKGQLEMEGIPAAVEYEAASRVFPVTIDGLAAHRLVVPESLAGQAAEVLAAYEDHGDAAPSAEADDLP